MFETFNDFKIYLPKYLSTEQQERLFDELASYPHNIDKRFYTNLLMHESILFQGDGFSEIEMADYQNKSFHVVKGFLLSNTCDSSLNNKRFYSSYLSFAPILSLKKYEEHLMKNHARKAVVDHINSIKKQKISSIFFLPAAGTINEDCYVRLDIVFSLQATEQILNQLLQNRLFSLSDYSFYLLLFKLSVHFSRIQEKVVRGYCDS